MTLSGAIDMSSTAKEVNFVIPRSWSHEHTIAEKKKKEPKVNFNFKSMWHKLRHNNTTTMEIGIPMYDRSSDATDGMDKGTPKSIWYSDKALEEQTDP